MLTNNKMDQYCRCNFGGGAPKAPPPPNPPVPPAKEQAGTMANKTRTEYDPRKGRASTILTDESRGQEQTQKKTLLGG
jgi:hypothetical protein